jgi:hypothetical protein
MKFVRGLLVEGGDGRQTAKTGLLRQLVNVKRMDHSHSAETNYSDAKWLISRLG